MVSISMECTEQVGGCASVSTRSSGHGLTRNGACPPPKQSPLGLRWMSRWLRAAWLQGWSGVTRGEEGREEGTQCVSGQRLSLSTHLPTYSLVILVAKAKPHDSTGCLPFRAREGWRRRSGWCACVCDGMAWHRIRLLHSRSEMKVKIVEGIPKMRIPNG
ncbi:hypothetical protein LZ30DRAFT_707804 [Colletotrichum cereale]|nr:hypothetical protein LZ30DRAFT_707804 [Colletotrichum cereale]